MSDKKESDFCSVLCASCGLAFGFPKEVEKIWRDSHKTFHCPNGHSLSWPGKTPKEKEHDSLVKQVSELKLNLAAALKDVEVYQSKIAELTAELELWKPSAA